MPLHSLVRYLDARREPLVEGVSRDAVVLEMLEERIAPAVIASVQGGTLKIVGDDAKNDIVLRGDESSPGTFVLSSSSVEINGTMEEVVLTGVKNISILMGDGEDTITFDGESPVSIDGWLKIDGGTNLNHITATNLSVGGDLKILSSQGLHNSGGTKATLTDTVVGGDFQVKFGTINNVVSFLQSEAGASKIEGDALFTGASDYSWANVILRDTFVGGDVVGKTKGSLYVSIGDTYGSGATIGGDFLFKGSGRASLNTEIFGDARMRFDGDAGFSSYERAPGVPSVIHGDVSVKTAKAFYDTMWSGGGGVVISTPFHEEPERFQPRNLSFIVGVGLDTNYAGLEIGGNLSISGNHGGDYVHLTNLKVAEDTMISLGNGSNSALAAESVFTGSVLVKCGRDFDRTNFGFSGTNVTFGSEPKVDLGRQKHDGGVFVVGGVYSSGAVLIVAPGIEV